MRERPTLTTDRLVLRPFTPADALRVRDLAGHPDIAATTLRIPHPYELHHGEKWIGEHAAAFDEGRGLDLAVTVGGDLAGAMSIGIDAANERGELGYWIGRPYWGRGYATEAAAGIVRYGFEALGLNRVTAHHFARNPASGRVMEKIGMTREGEFRRHLLHRGRYEDLVFYGILRSEHAARP